jgi:hypothetical protein
MRASCEECSSEVYGRGLCMTHYDKLRRSDPDQLRSRPTRDGTRSLLCTCDYPFVEALHPWNVFQCGSCGKKVL